MNNIIDYFSQRLIDQIDVDIEYYWRLINDLYRNCTINPTTKFAYIDNYQKKINTLQRRKRILNST
jgi:hypothetical protein